VRLWSLHPEYLDARGLVALWREALLAQAVLAGRTRGYRNHPQLVRFRQHPDPMGAIAAYLSHVQREATRRGYHFDTTRIVSRSTRRRIDVSSGQLRYEFDHLKAKLKLRDRSAHARIAAKKRPAPHPLFVPVRGAVAEWEVIRKPARRKKPGQT
jgi:hypothetical protein